MSKTGVIPALARDVTGTALPRPDTHRWEPLRGGDFSRTWRIAFASSGGTASAIVKWTAENAVDAGFIRREAKAYAEVLSGLEVRTPRLLGSGADSNASCLVLEDLSPDYRFHGNEHRWDSADLRCLVVGYAGLHTAGRHTERSGWMLGYQSPEWTPQSVAADVAALQEAGAWNSLGDVGSYADRVLSEMHVLDDLSSLLHLDCDPSNAGIARSGSCSIALIDWDMAGWGAPELDLAYLRLHPFAPAESVPRPELLDIYWGEWRRRGLTVPDAPSRARRQAAADGLLALALVGVARRSLDEAAIPGERAARYWSKMRPRLFGQLSQLVSERGT